MDSVKKNYALLPDVLGIALCALGLLLAFSLISFSSEDNALYPVGAYQIENWIGPGGALLSNIFYTLFGFLAWCFPMLFLGAGLACFWRKFEWGCGEPIAGAILLFCSASITLEHLSIGYFIVSFPWGGLLGYALHAALVAMVSQMGMWLLVLAMALSGAVLLKFRFKIKLPASLKIPVSLPSKTAVTVHPTPIMELPPPVVLQKPSEIQEILEKADQETQFELPALKLLDYDAPPPVQIDERVMKAQAERLEKTFAEFGIIGQVREIRPGPVVTCFEFVPAPGIKLSRIAALADDIAMAMTAVHVRIVAPIPGKGAVGIELPNDQRETVYLKEIIAHPSYKEQPYKLCMALGKNIGGKPYFVNLADMPHVLIAGTTGSGKSVSVNAMICSILYRATPQDVRFLMIDPKMLELSIYEGIPHLLLPPIIDSKKAAHALHWAVKEMDRRYQQMNEVGVRDIYGYNAKISTGNTLPYIVVVVDEYAGLVMVARS